MSEGSDCIINSPDYLGRLSSLRKTEVLLCNVLHINSFSVCIYTNAREVNTNQHSADINFGQILEAGVADWNLNDGFDETFENDGIYETFEEANADGQRVQTSAPNNCRKEKYPASQTGML